MLVVTSLTETPGILAFARTIPTGRGAKRRFWGYGEGLSAGRQEAGDS